jgi:hypothetical protein
VASPNVAYEKHFESVRRLLPSGISQLSDNETLHDATLTSIELDMAVRALAIKLRGWNRPFREGRLFTLSYGNVGTVSISAVSKHPLPGAPGFGDLGYWEFDVHSPGTFTHRMLFSTGIELSVFFSRFSYTTSRTRGRR